MKKTIIALAATAVMAFALPAAAQSTNDMVGKWDGQWPKGPTQTFQFERIDQDDTLHGTIAWGAFPQYGIKAGSVRVDHMKMENGKFTLHDSKDSPARSEWVFKDGAFQGTRFEKTSPNTPTNHVTLKKVTQATSN